MRNLLIFALSFPLLAQQLSVRSQSKVDRAIAVQSLADSTAAIVRSFDVDVVHLDGKPAVGYFTLLYDQQSLSYVWLYDMMTREETAQPRLHARTPAGFHPGWLPLIGPNGILLFGVLGNGINVWDSSGDKANTLSEAEAKALAEARTELTRGNLRVSRHIMRKEDNPASIGSRRGFPNDTPVSSESPLKLLSVTRRGNGWELLVEGRWKELVLLNGDYQVISHQRVP